MSEDDGQEQQELGCFWENQHWGPSKSNYDHNSDDGQQQQELGCFWENQPWGPSKSNSDHNSGSDKAKEKSDALLMKPPKTPSFNEKKDEKNEGHAAETGPDKKRSRGSSATRSDKKISGKEGEDEKATEQSEHELHIWTERERRKKMRNMFSTLHSLLPQLPSKADKSTIVDEAVSHIKTLQHKLQKLQKQKLERLQSSVHNSHSKRHPCTSREAFLADQGSNSNDFAIAASNPSPSLSVPQLPVAFQTFSSDNVVLNICGDQAQFCVCSPKKPGVFTSICFVLEKHKIEVLSAHMSSDANRSTFMIQAKANGASNQFPAEVFPMEEIFRQAATEIAGWLSQN